MGGVVEAPVVPVHLAGKHRASLVGISADGDDGLDFPGKELVHVLGTMAGKVDADLRERPDRQGVDVTGGFRAGALDVEQVSGGGTQDALRHVAAAGVPGTEDKDGRFHERVHLPPQQPGPRTPMQSGTARRAPRIVAAG